MKNLITYLFIVFIFIYDQFTIDSSTWLSFVSLMRM